jgi:hypothetical protein
MKVRKETPDIMENLMVGHANIIKEESNKVIKKENYKIINRESNKHAVVDKKETVNFRLSIQTMHKLDDIWVALRRKSKINRSEIIEQAIEEFYNRMDK